MKQKLFAALLAGAALMMSVGTASAAIITPTNAGFEWGLTGWATSQAALTSVVTDFDYSNGASSPNPLITHEFLPVFGDYFLLIQTGAGATLTTNTHQKLINVHAGDTISGYAAFGTTDYMPYNDNAEVLIYDINDPTYIAIPWLADVAHSGDRNYIDWTPWAWTAPKTGTFMLNYIVSNYNDNGAPSWAMFDAEQPIPEPSTLILVGFGIAGAALLARKRNRA